ncbi:MAG: hypothetical protein HKN29_15535 [Rhodothermales bacterium]|nr:hypothetical protein [Rhodothermales bacterium]
MPIPGKSIVQWREVAGFLTDTGRVIEDGAMNARCDQPFVAHRANRDRALNLPISSRP